jgi:16S rRNA processing protein RimM
MVLFLERKMQVKYFSVGYVLKPQGLKGEVKVKPLTDNLDRFDEISQVLLKEKDGSFKRINVLSRRYMKGWVILLLDGFDNKDLAEQLRGKSLWIPRSMAKQLAKDNYFIADIIGCKVESVEGTPLGVISEVIKTGSNDVFVVDCDGKDILVPALKKIVVQVDIDLGRIVIDSNEIKELIYDEN